MKRTFILLALILALGCEEQEPGIQSFPIIRTLSPDVDETGALFRAEIVQAGTNSITSLGFVWDVIEPDINTSNTVVLSEFSDLGTFSEKVENRLNSGLEYIVRAFAIHESKVIYGNPIKFLSLGSSNTAWNYLENTRELEGSWGETHGNSIGNTGYLLFGNADMYSFDPIENSFTPISQFPNRGNTGTWHASILHNDALYFFSNINSNFYKLENDQWGLEGILPFRPSRWNGYYHGHSAAQNIYILSSHISYMYNTQTATWVQKQAIPTTAGISVGGTSLGNKAYVLTSDKSIWEYDIDSEIWTLKTEFPGLLDEGIVSFSANGRIYFGLTDYYDTEYHTDRNIWSFDPNDESWTQEESLPPGEPDHLSFSFSVGDKLYIGRGFNDSYDVWSYEPF